MSAARRRHVEQEARLGVGGVLATLPVLWMNRPSRDADHAYKPRQLALAARCGLSVPGTVVTNDPLRARAFIAGAPYGAVVKPLGANWLSEHGHRTVAHTHRLTPADLTCLEDIAGTAHQLQHWVRKQYEVRMIVVGDRHFATSIRTSDPDAFIDWRANYDALEYDVVDVPEHVARRVRAFMAEAGLMFSALDFVVTPEDGWVFLESNSGGQYGWLSTTWGSAISDAIVDLLAEGLPRP